MQPHALIIDDDANNLKVLAKLLSLANVSHTDVQRVEELDDALQSMERLDVVFLDLEMPEANGYEILPELRERIGQDIPVVACTVHTNEINNAREMGFHSFLGKPLQPAKFKQQLESILRNEPVWDTGGLTG